jgi:hypothetical protein
MVARKSKEASDPGLHFLVRKSKRKNYRKQGSGEKCKALLSSWFFQLLISLKWKIGCHLVMAEQ